MSYCFPPGLPKQLTRGDSLEGKQLLPSQADLLQKGVTPLTSAELRDLRQVFRIDAREKSTLLWLTQRNGLFCIRIHYVPRLS